MYNTIKTTEEFIQYALRKLGFPVIQIEIDETQIMDRLNDCVQKFAEYHYDGFQEGVLIVPTQPGVQEYKLHEVVDEAGNKITDKVILNVIHQLDYTTLNDFLMKASFHMLYNPLLLYNTYRDYDNFYYTLQYMDMIRDEFLFKSKFTYNYTNQTLRVLEKPFDQKPKAYKVYYIDMFKLDEQGNPEVSSDIFNNAWFKEYFVEVLRLQWGENISKYDDIKLVGGGKLNGDKILQRAEKNIEKLEQRLRDEYDLPPKFFMQ